MFCDIHEEIIPAEFETCPWCLIDKLQEERQLIPELVNALIGMVQQHCSHNRDQPDLISTAGLSSDEDAIFLLENLGYLEQVGPSGVCFRFKAHGDVEER